MNSSYFNEHFMHQNGHFQLNHTNHSLKCGDFYGLSYNFYGVPETIFWSITSILTTSLNCFWFYNIEAIKTRKALYHVLLKCLIASNIFAGLVLQPLLAYTSHQFICRVSNFLMPCSVFNVISTILSTTLLTINRLAIVMSVRVGQQNNWQKDVSQRKSMLAFSLILSASAILTALRVCVPNFATKLLTAFGVSSAIITIVALGILLKKLKHLSRPNVNGISDCNLKAFENSIRYLQLLLLSIFLSWVPLAVLFLCMRLIGINDQPVAISLTAKLFWLRPIADPLIFMVVCHCKGVVRRVNVVKPVELNRPDEDKLKQQQENGLPNKDWKNVSCLAIAWYR